MNQLTRFSIGLVLASGLSCKSRITDETKSYSDIAASFADCQVGRGYFESMRICVDAEAINEDRAIAMRQWVQDSLQKWASPMMSADPSVKFEPTYTCEEPHLTVFMMPGEAKGFAGCGVVQVYERGPDGSAGDESLKSEILHLVGIAAAAQVATYEEYGVCLADQPSSIMCLAARSSLRDSDGRAELYPFDQEKVQARFAAWVKDGKPTPQDI